MIGCKKNVNTLYSIMLADISVILAPKSDFRIIKMLKSLRKLHKKTPHELTWGVIVFILKYPIRS